MYGIGFQELPVILVIALIIFGPSKLPQIGTPYTAADTS